ncbi:MAG: hypothetical protein CMJ23_02495 [Phycisphaerae bacterium]|nr:hypothetical protein [Phycisphaerae bacterium]
MARSETESSHPISWNRLDAMMFIRNHRRRKDRRHRTGIHRIGGQQSTVARLGAHRNSSDHEHRRRRDLDRKSASSRDVDRLVERRDQASVSPPEAATVSSIHLVIPSRQLKAGRNPAKAGIQGAAVTDRLFDRMQIDSANLQRIVITDHGTPHRTRSGLPRTGDSSQRRFFRHRWFGLGDRRTADQKPTDREDQ